MLLNSWSIALLVCSAATILLGARAAVTALRVVRFWDTGTDTARQIRLENESWLSAMLMEYGLALQMISLLLLVLAADSFSRILVGAMCATGAFLANDFGLPALAVKIFGLFLYGFWILLHRLDLRSEEMPLTRMKFYYLLLLIPYLLTDTLLLLAYLGRLQPDIITSCCGVLFGGPGTDGRDLALPLPALPLMTVYYGCAGLLCWGGWRQLQGRRRTTFRYLSGNICLAIAWLLFFLLSLVVITAVISSYIYGLPSHRCPFDILQGEYHGIGYPIYILLFISVFAGMSAGAVAPVGLLPDMTGPVEAYRRRAIRVSLFLLVLFLSLITWFPAGYLVSGGER